jgi:hypothetical protein
MCWLSDVLVSLGVLEFFLKGAVSLDAQAEMRHYCLHNLQGRRCTEPRTKMQVELKVNALC